MAFDMCNHSYVADYTKAPRRMGERCPYPELYEKARSAARIAGEAESPALAMDDRGACIFHSREIAWKRQHDFTGKLRELLQLLDADGEAAYYDFAELAFVGCELGTESGAAEHVLRFEGTIFRRAAYFTGAVFFDSLELDGVDFQDGASFVDATFAHDLRVTKARFRGLELSRARLAQLAHFSEVEFLSFALFHNTHFTGTTEGYAVRFEDARFEGITDFSGAVFGAESAVGFLRLRFADVADFGGTQFGNHVVFSDVSFASATEFIDTVFATVDSAARYRGAAVELNDIEVQAGAVLTFMSTDLRKRMFDHDVQMSFKGDPAGRVRFENVNISRFTPASRDRLMLLAKSGKVEIGPGCIKYRMQTEVRTIPISQGNAPLVLELCQTFTNYFTASSGINLGLEIVERDRASISLFYYTDEDISEAEFLARLSQTEQNLWNLLALRPDEPLLALAGPTATATALSTSRENAIINVVDGISALLGTFFRVGSRIALGTWKEADTKALLGAIRFNDEGAESRALTLHRVIVDKYTGRTLLGFNCQQNVLLAPMVIKDPKTLATGKVRILFLGANSSKSLLELDQEVKKIHASLKLAKERDNLELKQEWAVTVDTLMQAMLDESPTIVHFSGHGEESGIILLDEAGAPKVVSGDALAELFRLFKDTIRCVVLNSCYSDHQARAIRRHIPYVVGMRAVIPDLAAVAFSTGFYKALGAGRAIPFAFDMGKAAMRMEGFLGEGLVLL